MCLNYWCHLTIDRFNIGKSSHFIFMYSFYLFWHKISEKNLLNMDFKATLSLHHDPRRANRMRFTITVKQTMIILLKT